MDDSVGKLIDLAKQVGGAAWPLLVEATRVKASIEVGFAALFVFVVAPTLCVMSARLYRATTAERECWSRDTMDGWFVCLIFAGFIAFFGGFVLVKALPYLLAPEAMTARDLAWGFK